MAEVVTDRETAVLVPVPAAERVVSPQLERGGDQGSWDLLVELPLAPE